MRNALGIYIHILCIYMLIYKDIFVRMWVYVSFFLSKITTFERSRDSRL